MSKTSVSYLHNETDNVVLTTDTSNTTVNILRRVWRYQRGNQNPYIEEEQTTQWSKEKVQKDKQRSTKHTYKAKDRVTRTTLKTWGELRCSGRVSSPCSTSDTRSNCDLFTSDNTHNKLCFLTTVSTNLFAIHVLMR
jgi:hypothetical protein